MLQELMQWSKNLARSSVNQNYNQTISQRKSKDGRGILLQLANAHPAIIANYELQHEDGRGSIVITLYHLRKLYVNLEQLILSEAKAGHLSHAESLWKQIQTIDLKCYTHHLQVFHLTKTHQLIWSMELDFHKPSSYASGTAVEVIKNLLLSLLNQKYMMTQYQDHIELLLKENWDKLLIEKANLLYESFKFERINILQSPYKTNKNQFNNAYQYRYKIDQSNLINYSKMKKSSLPN